MPIVTRTARALLAACLAVATLVAVLPDPVAALQPPRPLPGYRAHFVTQTDKRPLTNCLWASASMLLDKWTNGDVRIHHQELRERSGDRHGGSSFEELAISFEKLGLDLEYSPDGGTRITFWQMLARLRKGAGAIVLGDYSELPRYYGRWDYGFWKLKEDEEDDEDNHAVYVERYDRARGRVWLMDPLAPRGWKGEWISIWALRRFAWSSGGALYVAMTPTAKAAPFAKVKVSRPNVVRTDTAIDATWTLRAPKSWRYPGADARVAFERAEDPLRAAAVSPELPVAISGAAAPERASVSVHGKRMRLSAPLPVEPGAYVGTLEVRDRRFGRVVAHARELAVFIPGERRATVRLIVRRSGVEAGSAIPITVNVANTGEVTWADGGATGAGTVPGVRSTRLVARWIALEVPGVESDADGPAERVLESLPLAAGQATTVEAAVMAPEQPGRWALAVDVVDDVAGSYAALGSAPAVVLFEVVEARRAEAIE